MIKSIYYYETFRNSLRNFLRQKGIKMPDMIREIAEKPEDFMELPYIPQADNLNKLTINLSGEWKDFKTLQDSKGDWRYGEYMAHLIYNYMYKHKDDERKKVKNKILSVWLTSEEWAIVAPKIGKKSVTEFLKECIL